MNKIGTAHVLLRHSIYTLPIEEEYDGRGGLCAPWLAMGVSSLSMTGGASELGVGFREADPRPWKTVLGKRLRLRRQRWTGSSAAYDMVDEADALRWTSALM